MATLEKNATLVYMIAFDCYFLVSDDRTASVQLPQALTPTIGELMKPEKDRFLTPPYGEHLKPWIGR